MTRDGITYGIRPIQPDDGGRELHFIRGLSDTSRFNRLMYTLREPSSEFIHQLVHVDYRRTMALVAVVGEADEERIIGVARYAADDSGGAVEFAVAVTDEWQARGIGTTLTRLLFEYATAVGIERIYGTILADNERMIRLVHSLGLKTHRDPEDSRLLIASRTLT